MLLSLACWLLSADAVSVSTKPRVLDPDRPSVTVVVHEKILAAYVDLTRSDGEKLHVVIPTAVGTKKEIKLEQPVGKAFDYEGMLHVEFGDGTTGDLVINLANAEATSPLMVETWGDAGDVKAHRFHFKMNRAPDHVEMKVIGESGAVLAETTVKVPGGRANVDTVIEWPATSEPVVRIEAKFHDTKGLWRGVYLHPWFIDVPHDEVLFQTNKYDVQPSEQPKLDKALKAIVEASAKAKQFATITLFVLGHTDTVGKADDNMRLSSMRARSIAAYFKSHGWDLKVKYAGLGETALLVATADDKDEPLNRRAQYIVSIDPPPLGRPIEWASY